MPRVSKISALARRRLLLRTLRRVHTAAQACLDLLYVLRRRIWCRTRVASSFPRLTSQHLNFLSKGRLRLRLLAFAAQRHESLQIHERWAVQHGRPAPGLEGSSFLGFLGEALQRPFGYTEPLVQFLDRTRFCMNRLSEPFSLTEAQLATSCFDIPENGPSSRPPPVRVLTILPSRFLPPSSLATSGFPPL